MSASVPLRFRYYTLFPEAYPGMLGLSVTGKALDKGLWTCGTVNLRDYCEGAHKHPDDTPYGGGAGMVMRADILGAAFEAEREALKIYYPSPRGAPFTQAKAREIAASPGAAFLCGRFEGVDERLLNYYDIEEISIGDYVLSNGDIAAQTISDACVRLLPGALGNADTLKEESFSAQNAVFAGLLEYPLYTRPVEWKGMCVPDILTSGHHAEIERWRSARAREVTEARRPDLWAAYLAKQAEDAGK